MTLTTASEIPQNELYRCASTSCFRFSPDLVQDTTVASQQSELICETGHSGDRNQREEAIFRSSDTVAVRLESDELNGATMIVSTGLDCERTRIKRPGSRLDVTC